MRIIQPHFKIETEIDGNKILDFIEVVGRTCYKSENKISTDSAKKFVSSIINSGHESVIEHFNITVRIICDRGVSHEIVRHRIASYSQESTRYCNYSDDKFGSELTFIDPLFWSKESYEYKLWVNTMKMIEENYMLLAKYGAKPEEARSILPNSLKTEIVVTMNLREWRHFFKLRTSKRSHPQMRQIAVMILDEFKKLVPIIFDDII